MARSVQKIIKRNDIKVVKNDEEELNKKYIENEEDTVLSW